MTGARRKERLFRHDETAGRQRKMVNRGDKTAKRPKANLHGRRLVFYGAVCAVFLAPTMARSAAPPATPETAPEMTLAMTAVPSGDAAQPLPEGGVEFVQQCQQRVGPFVTQSTAYQRLQQAQSQGYGVSGVFPCYDGGGRGYCFNVFYSC
jgi:hypothetical protein